MILAAVPVRTTAEHPLRLHSWTLRFYDAATIFQPAPEAADAHLREVLASAAADAGASEVQDVADLTKQGELAQPLPVLVVGELPAKRAAKPTARRVLTSRCGRCASCLHML